MRIHLHERPGLGFHAIQNIYNLFEGQIENKRDQTALIFENRSISYGELSLRVSELSDVLLTQASDDTIIGISCTPSLEMVIAVLAVLKSGKSFIAIEAGYSDERIRIMCSETGLKYVLSSGDDERFSELGLNVLKSENVSIIRQSTLSNPLAYIVYTSGSTGCSKGVGIRHDSLLNYIFNSIEDYTDETADHACSFFHLSLAFDASLTALFASLCTGKTLVIASRKYTNPFSDPNYLKYAPYDFLKITPYQIFEMEDLNDDRVLKAARKLVIGGEPLHSRHLSVFREKEISVDVINEYGPSETCVGCISSRFNTLDKTEENPYGIPVGKPMKGVEAFVMNRKLKPVSNGGFGEIVIGGIQVADAYTGNSEICQGRFIRIPAQTGEIKMYRTGDYAKINRKGLIEFICREDRIDAVMARKFNSRLLEMSIMKVKGIRHAVVIAAGNENQLQYPVCYVKMKNDDTDLRKIETDLKMVFSGVDYPVFIVKVSRFPLSLNHKLNRHALPVPMLKENGDYTIEGVAVNKADILLLKAVRGRNIYKRKLNPGLRHTLNSGIFRKGDTDRRLLPERLFKFQLKDFKWME